MTSALKQWIPAKIVIVQSTQIIILQHEWCNELSPRLRISRETVNNTSGTYLGHRTSRLEWRGTMEEGYILNNELEVVEGMQFDRGYL